MTENEKKQQLSIAYVQAVAARAGFACDRPSVDDDSVDVVIGASGSVHDKAVIRSPRIELQLKATAQDELNNGHLAFPLPVKNYDDLRGDTLVPRLLVVLQLPEDSNRWLEQTEDQMISRRCAFWLSLRGEPETGNSKTVTVHLPRGNCFTVDALQSLMLRVARKESL